MADFTSAEGQELDGALRDLESAYQDALTGDCNSAAGDFRRLLQVLDAEPLRSAVGTPAPHFNFAKWWADCAPPPHALGALGQLRWPGEREDRVACRLALVRQAAERDRGFLVFTNAFVGREGNFDDRYQVYLRRVVQPLIQDMRELAERSNAMSLENMLRDQVTVVKEDGRRFENLKAGVHPDHITVLDKTSKLPITEGDLVTRVLPNGTLEEYDVLESTFRQGRGHFPPTFMLAVRKRASRRPSAGTGSYTIFNVSGPSARVNINSEDLSHNVVTVTPPELFTEIRKVLETKVEDAEARGRLLRKLEELEAARGSPTFGGLYVQFMSFLADHAGVIGFLAPHLPALAQLAV